MKTLTEVDIRAMIENEETEGRTLSLKEQLPGNLDSDKLKFVEEAASLANAGGGEVVFGIADKRDSAGQPTGVAGEAVGVEIESVEKVSLRLDQLLQTGVRPRIQGYRLYPVGRFKRGPVIVLQVPRSWSGPHMIVLYGKQRFYSRNSAGKCKLDVDEIRAAFVGTEAVAERITRFRDERLGRIIAGDPPTPLGKWPKIVHFILPTISFGRRQAVDLKAATNGWSSVGVDFVYEYRLNIDGLLCLGPPGQNGRTGYAQLFRSGAIETVAEAGDSGGEGGVGFLHTHLIEDEMAKRIGTQCLNLPRFGVEPPYVVCGALLDAKRCRIPNAAIPWFSGATGVDRDVVILPEVTIDDVQTNARDALVPLFEAIYEAGGCFRHVMKT